MPAEPTVELFWRINPRHAYILGMLTDEMTEEQIAVELGVTISAVKSTVTRLEEIANCGSVRELRRWWRGLRPGYLEYVERASGIRAVP